MPQRIGSAGVGHTCDVYERWPGLGGQVATIDVGDGLLLERYYHHLFTSDRHIAALYEEIGLPDGIEWFESSVAMFCEGRSYPFTSPLDLLRFTPLSLRSRLRMGYAALMLQRRHPEVGPFESITAHRWIVDSMGTRGLGEGLGAAAAGQVRRPRRGDLDGLAVGEADRAPADEGQGGPHRDARLSARQLGAAARAPADLIVERGGRVLIDRPAISIGARDGRFEIAWGAPDSFRAGHDPARFERGGEPELYDAVIATVPNHIFKSLLEPELERRVGASYIGRLDSIVYDTALCALLEIDRPLTPYYWTNIADNELPFVGLIEQTNLIPAERYGGRHFLYIANYLDPSHRLLELSPDELLAAYEPGLRKVSPEFDLGRVRERWVVQGARRPADRHRRLPASGCRRSTPASLAWCWRTRPRSTPRTGAPTTASSSATAPCGRWRRASS